MTGFVDTRIRVGKDEYENRARMAMALFEVHWQLDVV